MTKCSKWLAGAGVLMALVLSAGCSATGFYDYEFSSGDAVGTWRSVDTPSSVELVLDKDGTFVVKGWPEALFCDGKEPHFTRDSEGLWRSRVSFEGEWRVGGEGANYVVRLVSDGPECRSNWSAHAWRTGDSTTELQIPLSPLTASDEMANEHFLYLRKLSDPG